jgi:Dehydrogenases with different specificities (related to short-chain alcohol dehydrogenases)
MVTGGTRGLGLEIARLFWSEGANLIVVARSVQELDKLREALAPQAAPGQVFDAVAADLSSDSGLEGVMGQMQRRGGVEILVNNAAMQGPIGKAWECDWQAWQAVIKLDLLVPVQLCRAAVPAMLRTGKGSIINLSGGGATGPRENFSAYASAKTALVRFTETLAAEVKPHRIRVNALAPGAMNTAMMRETVSAGPERAGVDYQRALDTMQKDSAATAQRAAELCLFLASDESAGLTGRLLSAVWDPWQRLSEHMREIATSDVYTLRRIVPKDRGQEWAK